MPQTSSFASLRRNWTSVLVSSFRSHFLLGALSNGLAQNGVRIRGEVRSVRLKTSLWQITRKFTI